LLLMEIQKPPTGTAFKWPIMIQ